MWFNGGSDWRARATKQTKPRCLQIASVVNRTILSYEIVYQRTQANRTTLLERLMMRVATWATSCSCAIKDIGY